MTALLNSGVLVLLSASLNFDVLRRFERRFPAFLLAVVFLARSATVLALSVVIATILAHGFSMRIVSHWLEVTGATQKGLLVVGSTSGIKVHCVCQAPHRSFATVTWARIACHYPAEAALRTTAPATARARA